jgi:phosphatidylglycerophosphate synthase
MDLYAGKPALVRHLEPVLAWLEHRGVAPDLLTISALPIAGLAAIALLVSPVVPLALLLVPFAVVARLALNLIDGALARRTGRIHPRGAFYNEFGDRTADIVMLAPVAVLPGAHAPTVWLGVVVALLASFTSVATQAAGGRRSYRGILSKPGRMLLLSVVAVGALVFGPGAWAPFGPVLVIGGCLTLLERTVLAVRELP